MIVVSDTSPVRALHHIDLLSRLHHVFHAVMIPTAVAEELLRPSRRFPIIDVAHIPFFQVCAPNYSAVVNWSGNELDPGEREAIQLAVDNKVATILIDEKHGRRQATALGLTPIGTLGVLIEMKQRGIVAEISSLVNRLQSELGFYVSPELRQRVLERAGEE